MVPLLREDTPQVTSFRALYSIQSVKAYMGGGYSTIFTFFQFQFRVLYSIQCVNAYSTIFTSFIQDLVYSYIVLFAYFVYLLNFFNFYDKQEFFCTFAVLHHFIILIYQNIQDFDIFSNFTFCVFFCQDLLEHTLSQLEGFALEGLRTLMVGSKVMPEDEYARWDQVCSNRGMDGMVLEWNEMEWLGYVAFM